MADSLELQWPAANGSYLKIEGAFGGKVSHCAVCRHLFAIATAGFCTTAVPTWDGLLLIGIRFVFLGRKVAALNALT